MTMPVSLSNGVEPGARTGSRHDRPRVPPWAGRLAGRRPPPHRKRARPVRLYDSELDAGAYSARLMLSLLGLPHERVPVNRFPGQEAPPVPELHDGDITASGTAAPLGRLAPPYAPHA